MESAGIRLARAAREAVALLVPVECVGCGEPGIAVCPGCSARMDGRLECRELEPGFPVWAGTEYTDVARRAILALKNDQRTDASSALARVLLPAIDAAIDSLPGDTDAGGVVTLAALPSTRAAFRRRGYRPVDVVVARTAFRLEHPLVWRRQPGDQIGLGVAARQANLSGALRAKRPVTGRRFLLVDDVVTTGQTLREARRAVVEAGGSVIGAAVIAATPRLFRTASSRAHFAE